MYILANEMENNHLFIIIRKRNVQFEKWKARLKEQRKLLNLLHNDTKKRKVICMDF